MVFHNKWHLVGEILTNSLLFKDSFKVFLFHQATKGLELDESAVRRLKKLLYGHCRICPLALWTLQDLSTCSMDIAGFAHFLHGHCRICPQGKIEIILQQSCDFFGKSFQKSYYQWLGLHRTLFPMS